MNSTSVRSRPTLAGLCLLLGLLLTHQAGAGEFCFGAAGQQCGEFRRGALQGIAFCASVPIVNHGICQVSGGSMTHDPCCASHPDGVVCGKTPETGSCQVEWDRSVHRAVWGYHWNRLVNTAREYHSATVVRADYCAKPGAGVHRLDRGYCCSGRSHRANFWDRLGRPNLYRCDR